MELMWAQKAFMDFIDYILLAVGIVFGVPLAIMLIVAAITGWRR